METMWKNDLCPESGLDDHAIKTTCNYEMGLAAKLHTGKFGNSNNHLSKKVQFFIQYALI